MISQPCSLRQNYHLHFGEKLSVPKSMSGIVFLHPLSRVPLPMRPGSSANQIRVWECLAYVFIQKDKCHSLQPHMEQCVFVGYPSGYKGWKFYNPSTKKYIISEQAEFDEHVFPGLSKYTATSPVDLTTPDTVPLLSDTTQDLLLNLGGMVM